MKQVRQQTTTTFDSEFEARCFLVAAKARKSGDQGKLREEAVKFVPGYEALAQQGCEAVREARDAAIKFLAEVNNVSLPTEHPAEAMPQTYVSGSSDRCYDIRRMPTRYIVNVLHMDSERQARGLVAALRAELRRRGESA